MYFNTNLIKAHGIVHIFKLFKKNSLFLQYLRASEKIILLKNLKSAFLKGFAHIKSYPSLCCLKLKCSEPGVPLNLNKT